MELSRRALVTSSFAAASLIECWPSRSKAADLPKVRVASGFVAMSVGLINLYVGEQLGFASENGIEIVPQNLSGSIQVLLALDNGTSDIGLLNPPTLLPMLDRGTLPDLVAFYEYTYPYKYDVAVRPDSPIRDYSSLKGKKIGISNMASSEHSVTAAVLKSIGIDPSKDVSWIAVGENMTAGIALDRGDIDALAYFDSPFGLIESGGIKLRYLPRPRGIPKVGALMLGSRRDYLAKNRDLCVRYGRTVSMASEYIIANPLAAATAFVQQFPATAPRGMTLDEAARRTVVAMGRRTTLYKPDHPNAKMGTMFEADWNDEARFGGFKVQEFSKLYTNDLIAEINNYDHQKVIAMAKAARN